MPFQVEKDIDITDFAKVEEEVKRLMKQLGYVKTQVTNAEKGVKTLEKTEDLLTSNVDGAKRLRVSKSLENLEKAYESFEEIAGRISYFHTCQQDLVLANGTEAQVKKVNEDITEFDTAKDTYDNKYWLAQSIGLRIQSKQSGPVSTNSTATTSDKRWKPRDEYKPDKLHLSDRPTALDTWVSKLKSYLSGHEKQPHNDLYNLLDCLIDDEIKTEINFNRRDEIPIFGENGDSLVEQILEIWKKEYPINKLRMALFEMKCGPNEDWNSWEAKMKEEASKADLNALKGEDILALLIIMKYEGPHATKIKSELSKKANSSDEKEICLLQARKIYSDEKYSSRFVTPSTVKQITPQQGGKNPNRGQRQANDKGSTRSSYAVYNQNQTRSGTSRKSTKFMDTEKAKEMIKEGRCTRCYKQNCPGKAKDKKCPDIKTLSCTYCKKINKIDTGHVEDACVTKWTRENNQQGESIRQIFNEGPEEEEK